MPVTSELAKQERESQEIREEAESEDPAQVGCRGRDQPNISKRQRKTGHD